MVPGRRTLGETMNKTKIALVAAAAISATTLAACSSDADVASSNLSRAAEQFEVNRRIVFFNGITDKYLLEIQGRCSVESSESALGGALEVTCKIGPNDFRKHFLGLSDNVSYLVEQTEGTDVSVYNYRIIFKPEVIVPDIDLVTSR
jgi:kynureninase